MGAIIPEAGSRRAQDFTQDFVPHRRSLESSDRPEPSLTLHTTSSKQSGRATARLVLSRSGRCFGGSVAKRDGVTQITAFGASGAYIDPLQLIDPSRPGERLLMGRWALYAEGFREAGDKVS
jgi:hypothetical protein